MVDDEVEELVEVDEFVEVEVLLEVDEMVELLVFVDVEEFEVVPVREN